MSKFSVKIKLQGLEIEVEGSQDVAPRIAKQVSEQIGTLMKPPMMIEMGKNNNGSFEADDDHEDRKSRKKKSGGGGGGGKSSPEDVVINHDPVQHGSPSQEWTATQKAIWLLWVAESPNPLSGGSITKAFNTYFKSAGAIITGNVNKALEKERLKGTSATVGANISDGTAHYYLTDTGKALGAKLAKGQTD